MKNTIKEVWSLMAMLRECFPLFIAATIVTAFSQITTVGVAVTSVGISTSFFTNQDSSLTGLFALLFSLVLVNAISTLLDVWWSHEVAYRILHVFRVHIYKAIKRIAPLGLQGKRTGDVASAAMNDAETLEWFYAHTASTAICAVLNSAVFIIALCVLIGSVGLIMALPIVAMILIPLFLLDIQGRQGVHLRDALVELRVTGLDSIQGQRELRSLGMVAQQNSLVLQITKTVQHVKNRQTIRKAWESAFSAIATSFGSISILVILTGRVLDGTLDAKLLPVSIVLAGMSTMPALTLVGMLGRVGEIGACAHRIRLILQAKDPIPSVPDTNLPNYQNEKETLVAQNLEFSYESNKPVLQGINLSAKPELSLALVGKSGAGKTTLANLAMRFLDPTNGQVRFNGQNLRSLEPDTYRESLALVPQDCHIFAGTIRQNLELAKENSTDAEIWEALRAADIDELVTSLGGLDARVGDRGTTLSGGERQRIGIARAFLRNPQVLILDEPLANIDPFLEVSIAEKIRKLRSDRTTIVIAHRLASIRIAEQIVLLDSGQIAAAGTHAELKNNDLYRNLLGNQIQ
ncbi:ABC transporter, ATP-binding protein [Mobiluncus mulieris 28-1]|uniref:ABC transporter ATP-binding protein n=1 Tax=Mobiluncus mulieris TaxID=2052 RepID=UPI0001BE7F67|nr:ABC transporter ATP-binding protein [Mobiluncus mulieris]EEZ91459.1 ABC transporter, ATP-binding protein [Mobiluncus mulieris 28-1]